MSLRRFAIALSMLPAPLVHAQTADEDRGARVTLEGGILAVAENEAQFGSDGTRFDFRDEGGEDNLYPANRYAAAVDLGRHEVRLVYQPFELRTSEVARRDVVVDGTTFPEGTVLDTRYSFPFWRATWAWDLVGGPAQVAIGGGAQIRNAAIVFRSGDGTLLESQRNVGPVPLLSIYVRKPLGETLSIAFDADGFYAAVKYINGGDSDVEGSILDANLRAGFQPLPLVEVHATLRYLGGGNSGTSDDGFSSSRLQTLFLLGGVTLRI